MRARGRSIGAGHGEPVRGLLLADRDARDGDAPAGAGGEERASEGRVLCFPSLPPPPPVPYELHRSMPVVVCPNQWEDGLLGSGGLG